MSESDQQARLAALAARKAQKSPAADNRAASTPQPAATGKRSVTVGVPSTARICATAASTASFAAMVVAMGPLIAEAEREADGPPADVLAGTVATPTTPSVAVSIAPALLQTPPTTAANDPLAFAASVVTQPAPAPSQQPAQQPVQTAAPAPAPTPAPTAPSPSPSAAPTSAAPPPTTAPTTAAPPPPPPQNTVPPPPKSGASG